MKMVKLCAITFLVLEVLAIITHFEELVSYTGNVITAFLPIGITMFIAIAGILLMIKAVFK